MSGPIVSLGDLLVSILERGFVLAIRLDGPPGDRRLLLGIGLADAASPLLMALCATGAFTTRDPQPVDPFDDGW